MSAGHRASPKWTACAVTPWARLTLRSHRGRPRQRHHVARPRLGVAVLGRPRDPPVDDDGVDPLAVADVAEAVAGQVFGPHLLAAVDGLGIEEDDVGPVAGVKQAAVAQAPGEGRLV